MNIHINGQAYAFVNTPDVNITTALARHFINPQQSPFAIALNGHFIGKADYPNTMLKNGDSLDVLQPIQGG